MRQDIVLQNSTDRAPPQGLLFSLTPGFWNLNDSEVLRVVAGGPARKGARRDRT